VSVDRELLARYFRQLADFGVDDVVLDSLTADEAVALLRRDAAGVRDRAAPASRAAAAPASRDAAAAAAPGAPSSAAAALAAVAAMAAPDAVPAAGRAAGPAAAPAAAAGLAAVAPPAAPAAATAGDDRLRVLAEAAADCRLCRLHDGRTQVVFGAGTAAADVVVVGEAPGQEEDRTGQPFVGRAGKLLDLLLLTVGLPRQDVYICNVLKCRPPNNRNPQADEVAACTTNFLHGQLDAIAPRVLLAVGKFAAQALLASDVSIGRLRGQVHEYRGTPLIVTYHPAYLLRSPQMTRAAWQDFQLLRKVLDDQT
jgi:uracil-DNA glycosylase